MYCPRCNQSNPDDAQFCLNCGSPLQTPKPKKNHQATIIISAAAALAVTAAVVFTGLTVSGKIFVKEPTTTAEATESVTEKSVTEESTTEAVTVVVRPETDTSATTTTMPSTLQESTTAPVIIVNSWQNAPANQLYQPPQSSYLTTRYQAYVFCTDTAVQNYVKMRNGPSSTSFNTVGTPINNYEIVTVETTSVNGWNLCYYANTATEGWIRSDFLFTDPNRLPSLPQQSSSTTGSVEDVITHRPGMEYDYVRAGNYKVVTGDGDPLMLRQDPKLNAGILYRIPEGTIVTVEENSYYENGFVYVKFEQNRQKYEGFAYLQYLQYIG